MAQIEGLDIVWLGHASFRITGDDKVVYVDPWQIRGGPPADVILISHDHFDHLSVEDVQKVRTDETVIVAAAPAAKKLSGPVRSVKPGDRLTARGIDIEVVPAYNVNKFRSPGNPYHPQGAGYVGFVFTVAGKRVYFAGDTDVIPEMADIRADIALLPVSGTYVMTADEAVEAARTIQPKVAIPMHYGAIVGSEEDAQHFKTHAPVRVEILEKA